MNQYRLLKPRCLCIEAKVPKGRYIIAQGFNPVQKRIENQCWLVLKGRHHYIVLSGLRLLRSGFDFFRRVKTLRYAMTSFQDFMLK